MFKPNIFTYSRIE